MTRKIQQITTGQSFTQDGSNPSVFNVSGRLLWVQGEADGKPTYDFTVTLSRNFISAAGTVTGITTAATRYVGTRNGGKVHLFNDYPQLSNLQSGTTFAPGFFDLVTVSPGEGVNLQIYYNASTLQLN